MSARQRAASSYSTFVTERAPASISATSRHLNIGGSATRTSVAVITSAAALFLAGCNSEATSTETVTETVTVTAGVTDSVAGPNPDKTTDTADPAAPPSADDFTIALKILSKQCYGSAGCNVTFRIQPTFRGQPLQDGQTAEVTYEIKGSEDPYSNTFTMTSDGQASVQQEESVSTSGANVKLTATVTDVSVL
ncbi:hypothetical protein G9U51_09465 [Calidifontibacter sp. DB0510]|uniref:Uncharacterized protein n=1 Tax=Metallococcus carri TaxID=1656884 RepID=A0A967B0E4_9MICO|nr:hypothetical protein [Metallococcus carri]NHN56003.1 hypothetical protein [Metallococcus carri]NOP37540.1 hypothetical protein [Calidifontibacter sp. DB2511S]